MATNIETQTGKDQIAPGPQLTPPGAAPAAGALPAEAVLAEAVPAEGVPVGTVPPVEEESVFEDFPPLTKESVLECLRPVIDPEIRLSIVDLGLIYDVILSNEGKSCEIKLTLTTPMCPYGPMLMTQVQDVANTLPGVEDARVTLVWEPPWDPRTMASDYAKDKLNIW